MKQTVICGYNKHTGRQRRRNEDDVYAGQLTALDPAAPGRYLFVVADGVGGRQAGDWASTLAIKTLIDDLTDQSAGWDPAAALRRAFERANEAVQAGSEHDIDRCGAATTLVAAILDETGHLWWANVGDSRAYLLHDGRLVPITDDHSWVAEEVRRGNLTPEEAAISDRRNIITRSIGSQPSVAIDVGGPLPLVPGDTVLLCSDGLHGPVDDATIQQVAARLDPKQAVERLIEIANERGGPDNVSVAIGRFVGAAGGTLSPYADLDPPETTGIPERRPLRQRTALLIAGAILVLLLVLAAFARGV